MEAEFFSHISFILSFVNVSWVKMYMICNLTLASKGPIAFMVIGWEVAGWIVPMLGLASMALTLLVFTYAED